MMRRLGLVLAILCLSVVTLGQVGDARQALQDRIYTSWAKFVQADKAEVEILLEYQNSIAYECPPKSCFDVKRLDLLKEAIKLSKERTKHLEDAHNAEKSGVTASTSNH